MNLSTPFVIETDGLSNPYKNVKALSSLGLKVHLNSIFRFLGLNAAGRTTTIHPFWGVIEPDSDSAEVKTWFTGRGVLGSPLLRILFRSYHFKHQEYLGRYYKENLL